MNDFKSRVDSQATLTQPKSNHETKKVLLPFQGPDASLEHREVRPARDADDVLRDEGDHRRRHSGVDHRHSAGRRPIHLAVRKHDRVVSENHRRKVQEEARLLDRGHQ